MLMNVIPRKRNELLDHFKTPRNIWEASEKDLLDLECVTADVLDNIKDREIRKSVSKAYDDVSRNSIEVITIKDQRYPYLLKKIYDPPVLLYSLGRFKTCEASIAVVGSRRATEYGLQASETLSESLARCGFTIISGMARGVDGRAHAGALKVKGITTAVLGCGLDIVYPVENRELMKRIIQTGCVISEYPPGTPPIPRNFPARNRIISGLSKGVVVIEAAEKSGSLITAKFALEQGRDVFALPGNISSINSFGTNKLIRDGARIVTGLDDIFQELNVTFTRNNTAVESAKKHIDYNFEGLDEEEKLLAGLLIKENLHIDAISLLSNMDMKRVNSVLIMLELKGIVEQLPGKIFKLI